MNRPLRVLIVEDKANAREMVKLALERFDCAFQEAEDGETALRLIREVELDVILLDLKLPDLFGTEVLEQARAIRPDLCPVIVMTGWPEEETREAAERLGASHYVAKTDKAALSRAFSEATSTAPRPAEVVTIPAVAEDAKSSAGLATVDAAPPRTLPRLLVLDDRPEWLDHIREALGGEFALSSTTDPDEACRWAASEPFALAIIDVLLGSADGLEVLDRMHEAVPELRAVVLTDYPDSFGQRESRRRGAVAYLPKRELRILAPTIRKLLAQGPRPLVAATSTPVRVFLCYERTDKTKVREVHDSLADLGFFPWMDTRIVPGQLFAREIENAIAEVERFIYFLSRNSAGKEGLILSEVRQALRRQEQMSDDRIFFITARLDDTPLVRPLSERQWVDLFLPNGFSRLVEALVLKRT